MKPCIALVVPSLEHGGGVPSVAEFLYQVIVRSGRFEVCLISLSTSAVDNLSVGIANPHSWFKGVRVEDGIWRGRPFTRVGVLASELEFQRYKPRKVLAEAVANCDLIQVVAGAPAWANAVIGLGKPVALQVATRAKIERRRRDASPSNLVDLWRKAMTEITDRLDDHALSSVDAIQLENIWMLEYCKQINAGRTDVDICYAPPGVDAEMFNPLVERLSFTENYILCVGRLDDPRKNINLLLNAFSLLPDTLSHVNLVTAGSGSPPSDYWEQVKAMGLQDRVRHIMRPKTDELVKLYQNATVFVLPSDEEGLGVVILEAMACGLPVVSTRSGGPDGIITDGEDGFLVPLDDASVLAERMSRICSDLQLNQRMGREARLTIEKRYTEDIAGRAFLSVWDKLLQKAESR